MKRILLVVSFVLVGELILGCSSLISLYKLEWADELIAEVEPFEPFTLTEDMIIVPYCIGGSLKGILVIDTRTDEVVRKLSLKNDWSKGYGGMGWEENIVKVEGKIYVATSGHPYIPTYSISVINPQEGGSRVIRLSKNDVQNSGLVYDRYNDKVIVFHSWGKFSVVDRKSESFEKFVDPGIGDYLYAVTGRDGKVYANNGEGGNVYLIDGKEGKAYTIFDRLYDEKYWFDITKMQFMEDGSAYYTWSNKVELLTNVGNKLESVWVTNLYFANGEPMGLVDIIGVWNDKLVFWAFSNNITNGDRYVCYFDLNTKTITDIRLIVDEFRPSNIYDGLMLLPLGIFHDKAYLWNCVKTLPVYIYSLPDFRLIKKIEEFR